MPPHLVKAGYRIAQQNCFRCHNMGREGGQKSGTPWLVLSAWAMASPEYFAAYVRDPQSKNPLAEMPATPATMTRPSALSSPTSGHSLRMLQKENHDSSHCKLALVFAVSDFLFARRPEQHDRLRLELPVCAPCLDDGLDISRQPRHVARGELAVWHTVFYLSIITWETVTMILCWLGGFMMARALRKTPAAFIKPSVWRSWP